MIKNNNKRECFAEILTYVLIDSDVEQGAFDLFLDIFFMR